MKQRNKKIPGDKPQWMVMEEEDIENERNRRIGLRLVGRMTPGREYIVDLSSIPEDVIRSVERDVIGYPVRTG